VCLCVRALINAMRNARHVFAGYFHTLVLVDRGEASAYGPWHQVSVSLNDVNKFIYLTKAARA
jgi:hypothetical protein